MTLSAALALLFFAPLGFVYGRHVAHGLHRASAASGRPVLRLAVGRIVRVVLLILAVGVAIEGREAIAPGLPPGLARNGGVQLVLWLLDTIGGVALVLFFLSLPYVMGSIFGIAAAGIGRLVPAAETPSGDASGPDAADRGGGGT